MNSNDKNTTDPEYLSSLCLSYKLLKQRLFNFNSRIESNNLDFCCAETRDAFNKLDGLLPDINKQLRNFKIRIEQYKAYGQDYNYVSQPAKYVVKDLRHSSELYDWIRYHNGVCDGQIGRIIHQNQKTQVYCRKVLGRIRGFPQNPLFIVPYGGLPKALSTPLEANALFMSFLILIVLLSGQS